MIGYLYFFFFNDTATTEIYTLSLHDALPISGYDTADLYTFQFAPQQEHLTDGPSFGRLHLTMMERLRALPGVTAVGVVNALPLDEGTGTWRLRTDAMAKDAGMQVKLNFTGGDYFQAMGIDLLQGRTFTTAEAASPNGSAIVSRS